MFWKYRLTAARTHLRHLWREAKLRTILVLGLSLLFWAGLFVLFYEGFRFIVENVGPSGVRLHAETILFVFSLFFLSLQVMLIFSAGIILYGSLYASLETKYLMTLPVRDERIVLYRFQEAILFSTWGFLLLASPMLLAYGVAVEAPWVFFSYLPFLLFSFAYIPSALGAIGCLLLIRNLPELRRFAIGLAAFFVSIVAYYSILRTLAAADTPLLGAEWFKETYAMFSFTRGEWLPSTWLSHSLIDAARRWDGNPRDLPWLESGQYLVLLASNALMLHVLVKWIGGLTFREGYWKLASKQARKAKVDLSWIDRSVAKMLFLFPRQTQLLIVKDLRLFRRDPVQWSQFLIFFGLLTLYFANVDRLSQHKADVSALAWVNIVSFLNLAVVGLILSTFTTRFIYPLLSLEGRRFWILGLLPVDRERILWGKFLFAAGGSWLPCAFLVLLSDIMLEVSSMVVIVHQLICLLFCLGLSGLAVGLGAIMPNFREQTPSKIAAGFGGTLNLVLSALYILLIVLLTAFPCHFYVLSGRSGFTSKYMVGGYRQLWMALGVLISLVLAAAVTIIPLRKGLKAFKNLEI